MAVLEHAGLQPGDELKVTADDGHIVLAPVLTRAERRIQALERIAGKYTGMYPPGYLEALRDEWER